MRRKQHILTMISLILAGLLIGMNPVAQAAATETFHEAYQATSGGTLELSNQNGDVAISGWDQPTVDVTAEKKAEKSGKLENVKIEVSVTDAGIVIQTIELVHNPHVSVTYNIRVPANLQIKSVKTTNGDITLFEAQGDVTVESTNGEIGVQKYVGNVLAKSSNGEITLEDVKGYVEAETSNGEINVRNVSGLRSLETSNGEIQADIAEIQANVEITSSNGEITLALAPTLNAELDLETSNSEIQLHGIELITTKVSEDRVKGRIGSGGKLIRVETSNGKIILESLK